MTKKMKTLLNVMLLLGIMFSACDSKDNSVEEAREDVAEAVQDAKDDFQEEWKDVESGLKDMKTKIDKEIADIDAKMESSGAEAKEELTEAKQDLQQWSNKIGLKLQNAGKDMGDGWSDFKNEVKEMAEDVEAYFDRKK